MLAYRVKQSPLPSIGRITCLGCSLKRTNGPGRSCRRVCAGRHRRCNGQTGPLVATRTPGADSDPDLTRKGRFVAGTGGPGRPSRPSHPLPALWIGPGRRGGTHLAQAKGPLSLCQAPLASALPAPPTGTGWPVHASEARQNRAGRSRRGGGRRAAGGRAAAAGGGAPGFRRVVLVLGARLGRVRHPSQAPPPRSRYLRARPIPGRRWNICKIYQICKISNKIPNMQ